MSCSSCWFSWIWWLLSVACVILRVHHRPSIHLSFLSPLCTTLSSVLICLLLFLFSLPPSAHSQFTYFHSVFCLRMGSLVYLLSRLQATVVACACIPAILLLCIFRLNLSSSFITTCCTYASVSVFNKLRSTTLLPGFWPLSLTLSTRLWAFFPMLLERVSW